MSVKVPGVDWQALRSGSVVSGEIAMLKTNLVLLNVATSPTQALPNGHDMEIEANGSDEDSDGSDDDNDAKSATPQVTAVALRSQTEPGMLFIYTARVDVCTYPHIQFVHLLSRLGVQDEADSSVPCA